MVGAISTRRFNVYIPKDLDDALKYLSEYGEKAIPLAGGTDVLVLARTDIIKPELLVDLWPLRKELSYVRRGNGYVWIGALTSIDELYNSFLSRDKRYLGFHDMYWQFATPYLRTIATVGGNIGTAHPLSDLAILLLTLDAEVKLSSVNGDRWVKLENLYLGKRRLDRRPDELITEIRFKETPENSSTALLKLDRRRGHAMGYIVAAAYMALDGNTIADVRIAFDSTGKPYPGRAYRTEEFLRGKLFGDEVIRESYRVLEKEMKRISDYRAPAEYRLDLSKVLMKRCLYLIKSRIAG